MRKTLASFAGVWTFPVSSSVSSMVTRRGSLFVGRMVRTLGPARPVPGHIDRTIKGKGLAPANADISLMAVFRKLKVHETRRAP
jgi:hypothetical protein